MKQSNPRVGMGLLAVLALGLLGAVPSARAQDLRYPVGVLGKFTPQGMLVQVVQNGSEAARAGLQRGDLIVKIDGATITSQADFVQVINSSGGSVVLSVRKALTGKLTRVELNLALGVRPGVGVKAPYLLGVMGQYRLEGMLIQTVGAGTPASRIGLQPDDVIVRINNEAIRTQRQLFTVLYNSGGEVVLDVRKKGGRLTRLNVDLRVYELGVIGDFGPQGMRIRIVAPATPAERIGLSPGDLIVSIDNRAIRTQQDLDTALNRSGGFITLALRKAPAGVPVRLQAELINNPLGLWCEPATDGVRITNVPVSTPAEALGLERGDIIIKVDNQRVRTNRDLTAALRDSGGVANLYVRKGATDRLIRLEVVLGW
ncbi:MAG: PDZ domain-containing protein [Planctomycetes bacterium]|nr:PDZ domain-containing protein [Planctomycetota bacterium]